jgi:glutathione S-transferase
MRILGRISSINVRKVLWTSDEIGLSYALEDRWGTPDAPTASAEFVAINPNSLVPVIEDENGVLWESNTICRYLAAKSGRSDLLPQTASARARVEMWMDWQATDLNEAWRYAFLALARRQTGYSDPARIDESARRWNETMRILDRRLAETELYVAGENFTLADIVLGLSAHRWRMTPIDHAPAPSIARWLRRLEERPAFARYAPPETP